MKQQVNLLNPALITRKTILSLTNIGIAYGLLLLCCFAWSVYLNSQLSGLESEHATVEEELMALEDAALQDAESSDVQKPNQGLISQLRQLEATKQVHTKILAQLRDRQPQALTLSHYMQGLARQTVEGVWLTGFMIREKGQSITLRGRSIASEILPLYIKKLGNEPLFSGVGFAGLQVTLPEAGELPASKVDTSAVSSPQYVEFELQSLEYDSLDAASSMVAEVLQ